jgi:hypothetical protein
MSKLRQVKFFKKVRVHETIHIHDYSDDEFERSWYTKIELKEIKLDVYRTVCLMKTGELEVDDDSECSRGLESRIGEIAIRRKKIISCAIWVVLWEQEQQSAQKIIDSLAIAKVYAPTSKLSAIMAHNIGLRDESESHNCHDSCIEGERKVQLKKSRYMMRLSIECQRRAKRYAWTIGKLKLSH